MGEDLGVAARREAVAGALQLVAQRGVVEDLAVLHRVHAPVLGGDGLVAAGEVDDRQPARRQRDRAVDQAARVVGPAMDQGRAHRLQRRRVDGRAVERGQPADAAHGQASGGAARASSARIRVSRRATVASTIRR
jgi:hypothetical protein